MAKRNYDVMANIIPKLEKVKDVDFRWCNAVGDGLYHNAYSYLRFKPRTLSPQQQRILIEKFECALDKQGYEDIKIYYIKERPIRQRLFQGLAAGFGSYWNYIPSFWVGIDGKAYCFSFTFSFDHIENKIYIEFPLRRPDTELQYQPISIMYTDELLCNDFLNNLIEIPAHILHMIPTGLQYRYDISIGDSTEDEDETNENDEWINDEEIID